MLCVHDEAVLGWAMGTKKMEKFSRSSATSRTKEPEKRERTQPLWTGAMQPAAEKSFVEEGLSFGGYLLGVKFAAEDC